MGKNYDIITNDLSEDQTNDRTRVLGSSKTTVFGELKLSEILLADIDNYKRIINMRYE